MCPWHGCPSPHTWQSSQQASSVAHTAPGISWQELLLQQGSVHSCGGGAAVSRCHQHPALQTTLPAPDTPGQSHGDMGWLQGFRPTQSPPYHAEAAVAFLAQLYEVVPAGGAPSQELGLGDVGEAPAPALLQAALQVLPAAVAEAQARCQPAEGGRGCEVRKGLGPSPLKGLPAALTLWAVP